MKKLLSISYLDLTLVLHCNSHALKLGRSASNCDCVFFICQPTTGEVCKKIAAAAVVSLSTGAVAVQQRKAAVLTFKSSVAKQEQEQKSFGGLAFLLCSSRTLPLSKNQASLACRALPPKFRLHLLEASESKSEASKSKAGESDCSSGRLPRQALLPAEASKAFKVSFQ